ncbi:MAG: beta-glucosidase, partial [Clostridia bacterium]|nr:beta-glucosidase [Clostridia bacterium]
MSIVKGYDLENLVKAPVKELIPLCREVAAEGSVLLRNEGVLPVRNENLSVFGRCQIDYYKSGTGSGGLVNVEYKTNIIDALRKCDNVNVNNELAEIYEKWVSENPYDDGTGWEQPWSQKEMHLDSGIVKKARAFSEKAIVIIGRTAGESRDNRAE